MILSIVAGSALSTAACGVSVVFTAGKLAADGGLLAATDKTSTDHLASMVTRQDCAMFRIVRGIKPCKEREDDHDPYDVNYKEPFRSVAEDGAVQYGPPLRGATDAPAASWNAGTYETEPATPAPPLEPRTVLADAGPAASPMQAAEAKLAPRAKRGKPARSARKPSRGRAAIVP